MNALRAHSGDRPLLGIALVMGAVACFATLDTTNQWLGTAVPMAMALWFRFAFQAVSTTAVVLAREGRPGLRTQQPWIQLIRGLMLLVSSAMAFLSLRYIHVAEFTAVISLTPLIITMIAAWKLDEQVPPLRWALVIGGLAGTLVIVRPGTASFNWGMLLPLCLVLTSAAFQLLTSQLARTDSAAVTHIYTGWIGTVVLTLFLPFAWVDVDSTTVWLALGLLCVMATVGHFLLILAYRKTTPGILTPYLYGQVMFALLAGWIVFERTPDAWGMAGIALITLCGVLGTWLTAHDLRKKAAHGTTV